MLHENLTNYCYFSLSGIIEWSPSWSTDPKVPPFLSESCPVNMCPSAILSCITTSAAALNYFIFAKEQSGWAIQGKNRVYLMLSQNCITLRNSQWERIEDFVRTFFRY